MRKLKKATLGDVFAVEEAQDLLRQAREKLKTADCPQTLKRVRAALKSCDGAARHVDRRLHRTLYPHGVAQAINEAKAP